jgi:hypothetical protein
VDLGRSCHTREHVVVSGGEASNDAVGGAELKMPLGAALRIEAPGHTAIHRSLYLDFAPHRAFLEELATGRWLDRNDWRRILKPGQLPWEAFRFQETKALLKDGTGSSRSRTTSGTRLWCQPSESGL